MTEAELSHLIEDAWSLRNTDTRAALERARHAFALMLPSEIGADAPGEVPLPLLARTLVIIGLCHYRLGDFQQAISESQEALHVILTSQKAPPSDDPSDPYLVRLAQWRAEALNTIGNAWDGLGNYHRAIESFRQSLEIRQSLGDRIAAAASLNNIGNAHLHLGEYAEALDHHFRSLEIKRDRHDLPGQVHSLINLGNVHEALDDHLQALSVYEEAANLAQTAGNPHLRGSALNNMGMVCEKLGDLDRAETAYRQSLELHQQTGERSGYSYALFGLATLADRRQQDTEAHQLHLAALEIRQQAGERVALAESHLELGRHFLRRQILPQAQAHLATALDLATASGLKRRQFEAHELLAQIHEQLGDFPAALRHFRLFHQTRETLFGEENLRHTSQLKALHEAEQARKESEIQRLRNVELAEANRDLIAGITYARTIQQAILPFPERISASLPHHFLLYRPKDIVSGDFYWLHDAGPHVIIAVCDCTGHGVPGAFMSMIGSAVLDQTIIERRLADPGLILAELNRGIRHALRQETVGGATHDGMDVALCRLDRHPDGHWTALHFAGAKRPLYCVLQPARPDNSPPLATNARHAPSPLFREIKGERTGIGGRQKRLSPAYPTHHIALPARLADAGLELLLYLTTDGYADQPNPHRHALGSRRLKEILAANTHLSMPDQQAVLEAELLAHQARESQRDDITILGIKLR